MFSVSIPFGDSRSWRPYWIYSQSHCYSLWSSFDRFRWWSCGYWALWLESPFLLQVSLSLLSLLEGNFRSVCLSDIRIWSSPSYKLHPSEREVALRLKLCYTDGRLTNSDWVLNTVLSLLSMRKHFSEKFWLNLKKKIHRQSLSYLATITNYYRRHGFEFDCNQEATLLRGAKPLIDFN